MEQISVRIVGPVFDVSGISQCVREMALALFNMGIDVNLVDMPNFSPVKPVIEPDKLLNLNIMVQKQPTYKFVTIHFYPLDRPGVYDDKAIANIMYSLYETDRIPYYWKLILNHANIKEVFVPSEFNKNTYISSKVEKDKISIVPLGVDIQKYNPSNKKLEQFSNTDNFYFSYISELKICKGWDLLLKGFFEEFKDEPKAKLIFKCTSSNNPKDIENIANMIRMFKGQSKAGVELLYGAQSEEFMKNLYASADCFVLPSRGEGWGLGIIQSMASGVPVITSRCSAQLTYCNDKNSLLIDANHEKIHDINWLMQTPVQNEHWWWEPNYNQLKQKMRYAFENRDKIKEMAKIARTDVEQFSWDNTAMKLVEAIQKYIK